MENKTDAEIIKNLREQLAEAQESIYKEYHNGLKEGYDDGYKDGYSDGYRMGVLRP